MEESDPAHHDGAVQALVRAYVACRLAMDASPELPADIRAVVSEPVTTLCHVIGPELARIQPDFFDHDVDGPGIDNSE